MDMRRHLARAILAAAAALLILAPSPAAQAPATTAQPYRILISNDDGVRAPGILALAEALQGLGEITIAAPAENQSGKGHSIVIADPIFVDAITLPGGMEAFSIAATPATCVKVGIRGIMKVKPDLVVTGINRGYNLGMVTYVSGTAGGAREAALMGIPAIASSLAVEETNYAPAAQIVKQVAEMVKKHGLEPGTFLNVNIPAGAAADIKGIHLTRQSPLTGEERFEEQKSPRGRRMFWSVWTEPTGDKEGTDVWATEHGFAAVTPMRAGEFDVKTYDAWRAIIRP
jgi:5'-nucleotidase